MMNNESRTSEYHVASFVAYPIFEQLTDVQKAITMVDGSEIHATSVEGKIVFTIEGHSYKDIGNKMDTIRNHKGVINLSPVYHQVLDESSDSETN